MEKLIEQRRKEQAEIEAMGHKERQEWLDHIYSRSDRAYLVIGSWIAQARLVNLLRDEISERNNFLIKRAKD